MLLLQRAVLSIAAVSVRLSVATASVPHTRLLYVETVNFIIILFSLPSSPVIIVFLKQIPGKILTGSLLAGNVKHRCDMKI